MIPVAKPLIDQEEIDAAVAVLKSGMYSSGEEVKQFEKEFSVYNGVKYSVSCNSGTAAIHMALLALGVGPGDEVIVPSVSFFATVSPIMMVGAEPVFCEVSQRGLMEAKNFGGLITEKTKAIIPVHLHGHPCNMDEIMAVAKKYNLYVVEDCAQAHGAKFKDQKVGSFGDVGCFSFFATKNITTIEGGMITTNNEYIAEQCNMYRSHGMIDRDTHSVLGYNYRMNELSGAIGRVQLKKLDRFNEIRRQNSSMIYNGLFNNEELVPRDAHHFKWLQHKKDEKDCYNVYFWCPIFAGSTHAMNDFKTFLRKEKVGFRCRYTSPMYEQPIFKNKYAHIDYTNARNFCGSVIGLPNHQGMSTDDITHLVSILLKYFKV